MAIGSIGMPINLNLKFSRWLSQASRIFGPIKANENFKDVEEGRTETHMIKIQRITCFFKRQCGISSIQPNLSSIRIFTEPMIFTTILMSNLT